VPPPKRIVGTGKKANLQEEWNATKDVLLDGLTPVQRDANAAVDR
jgi:hypothetical protein